ncbi:MAG TPA: hypothetical protein VFT34_03375 [Verrucomicrobiae bacterium]|nr:hypothetical protein [Verrucomicrobiae bacterium]
MHPQPDSNLERIRHPEIVPLEISDVRVDGATLWEWSQDPRFASVLRRALERWHEGHRPGRPDEPAPAGVPGFEAAFLTGGRTESHPVRAELAGLPWPVFFGADALFAGERGGFDLLRVRAPSGWVADLGKSQFKLSAPGRRWVFARDWIRLPQAYQVPPAQVPAQRRRLREFIAMSLQLAMAESSQRPQALVFAIPTRLDADGTPGNNNYAGLTGDRALLPEALALAGLDALPLFVLNDAELAALSARTDGRLGGFRKVLVLTLGFGIGAAMIHRCG